METRDSPHIVMAVGLGITMLMMSVAAGSVETGTTADDQVSVGQALYEGKCSGCHSVDSDRIGPQQMAPGSKMHVQVDDPAQRRLIIAYLQSVSQPARQRQ